MSIPRRAGLRRRGATLVVVGLTALAVGVAPTANAARRQSAAVSDVTARPGPADDPGYPTYVHMPADQAAHPGFTDEWWYIVGQVSAGSHRYGYEVQFTNNGVAQVALTDITTGTYTVSSQHFPAGQFSLSSTTLDLVMPNASLSGPLNDMHLKAQLPDGTGTLDFTLDDVGPTLYHDGTGLFPFLGGSSYAYSLPHLVTNGTLTVGGKAERVTGTSWLDRQWGNGFDWTKLKRWTWMPIQLSNGRAINLWDVFETNGEEHHYATILDPDGSEQVVSVNPLAPSSSNFRTSPLGQHYAGKWVVKIPSQHTTLVVTATPVLQDTGAVPPSPAGVNEAASHVVGTDQGRPVVGHAYVEQFGNWK